MFIYLSHRQTGYKNTSDRYVSEYSKLGEYIEAYLLDWEKMEGFPKLNLYIPANNFHFIQSAYSLGFLSASQISRSFCDIISQANLFISFGTHANRTMIDELKHAYAIGVPIYNMPSLTKECIESLKFTIKLLLKYDKD